MRSCTLNILGYLQTYSYPFCQKDRVSFFIVSDLALIVLRTQTRFLLQFIVSICVFRTSLCLIAYFVVREKWKLFVVTYVRASKIFNLIEL